MVKSDGGKPVANDELIRQITAEHLRSMQEILRKIGLPGYVISKYDYDGGLVTRAHIDYHVVLTGAAIQRATVP